METRNVRDTPAPARAIQYVGVEPAGPAGAVNRKIGKDKADNDRYGQTGGQELSRATVTRHSVRRIDGYRASSTSNPISIIGDAAFGPNRPA